MTDREKLIDLKIKFVEGFDCGTCTPAEDKCRKCLSEKEADYLLKNGVLVLLIKPGDTVYAYNEYFGILPYLVGNFHIGYMGKEKDYLHWEAAAYAAETDELLDDIDFDLEDIGKDIFFTREEAEKALAKRSDSQ